MSATRSAILAAVAALLLPDGLGNIQLAQSPPQFDSSLKAATTAFVQRQGVQYGSVTAYPSSTALTAANAGGMVIAFGNSAPITFTLPASASFVQGASLSFLNASAYVVTITRAGTDQINPAAGTVTSVTLQPGDTFNAALYGTIWECTGGSAALAYASIFGSSLATSGYQKLPSGLIIQWGITAAGNGADQTQTLPIAYPNGFIGVFLTSAYTAGSGAIGYAAGQPVTSSSFTYRISNNNSFRFITLGY